MILLVLKVVEVDDQVGDRVAVPDVTGLSRAEADKRLRAAGLTPYDLVGSTTTKKEQIDTVIEQQPPAGTKVRPKSRVTVYLDGAERQFCWSSHGRNTESITP